MTETLSELAPDAEEKRQRRFELWKKGEGIPFETPEAKTRYQDHVQLIIDAIELIKTPQRVPICPSPGHFPLEYSKIRFRDAMYNHDALEKAWRKYYDDFDPDVYHGSAIGPGSVLEKLDNQLYNWPGHGVGDDFEYQFVEKEYMDPEEYDELINDPSWFHLTRFLPRIYGALKPLERFPQIVHLRHMTSMAPGASYFAMKEVRDMCRKLADAAEESVKWLDAGRKMGLSIMAKGLPSFAGGMAEAPYDMITDNLRGTRGIVMDMFKRPEKILEVAQKYIRPTIKRGVDSANLSGNPLIMMPLHKGADPYMSNERYQQFYWPTFRKVIMGFINEGLVPVLFAESKYNNRLEIISDLPKGKVIWWFESVDMARAKETVGQVACIAGNVSNIMFRAASKSEMEETCKYLIDVVGKNGGFILSTAAGLQGAKPENVKTFIEFGKRYGVYT